MLAPSDFLWWLVSLSFQAGILVLLILSVKILLGRFLTPWWHFALWFLVLARLVIPVGPESSLSLSNYIAPAQWIGQSSTGHKSFQGFLPNNAPDLAPSGLPANNATQETAAAVPNAIAIPFNTGMMLFLTWLIGTVAMLLILVRNSWRLWATLRMATPVYDPEIKALFESCRLKAGITRRVHFLTSDQIATPALAGIFRPVVLLPAGSIASTSAAELKFIILHELIHLRRGDLIIGCAAALLQAIHWFNPLIWIGFCQMRADREIACDAEVMNLLGQQNAADYGRTILKLAERASSPRLFAGSIGIIEVKSETGRRIIMISQHRQPSKVRAFCGFCIAAIIAAVSFTEAQSQPAGEAEAAGTIPTLAVPVSDSIQNIEKQPQQNHVSDRSSGISTATLGSIFQPAASALVTTSSGLMDGTKPFTLTVEESIGELIYTFNENSHELESIEAKREVRFSSAETTISCDYLTYTSSTQQLHAKGPGLEVRLPGEFYNAIVTADQFDHNLTSDEMVFIGGVRVIVKRPDGVVSETVTEKLSIVTVNGRRQFRLKARTQGTTGREIEG